eukprot:4498934-Amphidinium_carterae.1
MHQALCWTPEAFLIAHYTQRPLPVDTLGIGEWREVIHLLMKLGVAALAKPAAKVSRSFPASSHMVD